MKLRMTVDGDDSLSKWLMEISSKDPKSLLRNLGSSGVSKLKAATPTETGETASKWSYKIEKDKKGYTLSWTNSAHDGIDIIHMLVYGHGTGTGGYVKPNNFVSPAIRDILKSGLNQYTKGVIK